MNLVYGEIQPTVSLTVHDIVNSFAVLEKIWIANAARDNENVADSCNGLNLRPTGPWIAVGAFGPLLIRDFAIDQIAWGVASQFPILVSHRSSAFLRVIRLMVSVTQLTTVLYAGSGFRAIIFWASARALRDSLGQVYRYLGPKRWLYMSTFEIPRL
jgi:hypothetical protein